MLPVKPFGGLRILLLRDLLAYLVNIIKGQLLRRDLGLVITSQRDSTAIGEAGLL